MKVKPKLERGNVCLNVCLEHKVEFGEHVVTEGGWVCELEFKGGGGG